MTDAEKRLRERVAFEVFGGTVEGWARASTAMREDRFDLADSVLATIGLPLSSLAWAAEHPEIVTALAEGEMVAVFAGASFGNPSFAPPAPSGEAQEGAK